MSFLSIQNLLDRIAIFLGSLFTQGGYRAGMAVLKSKIFQGVSFGYLLTRDTELYRSDRWLHAIAEGMEPLRYYEKNGLGGARDDEDGEVLSFVNFSVVILPTQILMKASYYRLVPPLVSLGEEVNGSVALIDLNLSWKLPFHAYIGCFRSDQLIPLYFGQSLEKDREAYDFVKQGLCRYGSELKPLEHPIL